MVQHEEEKMSLTGTRIEFHILQSFPVTCLNRDDVGAPKSALIGGVSRARVSSQCWKRQVRLSLRDLGVRIGIRTKHVAELIAKACLSRGASEEQAEAVFPTPVGVFLIFTTNESGKNGLPHARGGVSRYCSFSTDCPRSSPRPWGCF